jgi:hypothetical protein
MTQATYPGYLPPTPPPTPPTPQFPAPAQYPQAVPGQLPQQYGQPYAPQQFAPGYPPAMPAPAQQPLAQGSIDDFYAQPSTGGGKAISVQGKQPGYRFVGVVARPITSGDIQQQTDTQQRPQFFKDGRPKFVMKVPLQMQPDAERPDGLAQWFVKGQARDELVRAMAEAGAPAGPPEAGAILDVTFTGTRPSGPGLNPANQFHVVYTRPDGQTSSPAAAVQAPPVQQPAPAPIPQVQYAPPQQVAQQQPPAAPASQPSVPAQAVAQPQPPAGLSPEQQALLAKLTAGGN